MQSYCRRCQCCSMQCNIICVEGALLVQFFMRFLTMSLEASFDEIVRRKLYFSRAYRTFRESQKTGTSPRIVTKIETIMSECEFSREYTTNQGLSEYESEKILCHHLDIETSKTMYNRKIRNFFSDRWLINFWSSCMYSCRARRALSNRI
jgi:hypothetical protein